MKITVNIDDGGLLRALEKAGPEAVKLAKKKLLAASFAVENRVKQDMPVDTSRARASWGHWTPGIVRNNPDATPFDAVWQVKDRGLTVVQGTNVPYVAELEEGSSRQAAAGFIERAARFGMKVLAEEVAKIVEVFGNA